MKTVTTPSLTTYIPDFEGEDYCNAVERAAELREHRHESAAGLGQALDILARMQNNRFGLDWDEMTALGAALTSPLMRDYLAATIITPSWRTLDEFSLAMLGQAGNIDWATVDETERGLMNIICWTPEAVRGPLYTLLSFLAWYRDDRAIAIELLGRAQDAGDTSDLAALLKRVLTDGTKPRCATFYQGSCRQHRADNLADRSIHRHGIIALAS